MATTTTTPPTTTKHQNCSKKEINYDSSYTSSSSSSSSCEDLTTPPKNTTNNKQLLLSPQTSTSSSNTSETLATELYNGEQTKLFQFAKKLGYPENLIQVSMEKLTKIKNGEITFPTQDELLSELLVVSSVDFHCRDDDDNDEGEKHVATEIKKRPIVVDGSNVVMSYNPTHFTPLAPLYQIHTYFSSRGHSKIKIFFPSHRQDDIINSAKTEQEKQQLSLITPHIIYTPSRPHPLNPSKRQTPYDDRYILQYAADCEGVVLSNDGFRDFLINGSNEIKKVVEERVLMFCFVDGVFTPPQDPLGGRQRLLQQRNSNPNKNRRNNSVSLEQFLSHSNTNLSNPCPYGNRCTFGSKCKYYHAKEKVSVADGLRKKLKETMSVPITTTNSNSEEEQRHRNINRTRSDNFFTNNSNNSSNNNNVVRSHKKLSRQFSLVTTESSSNSSSYLTPFPYDDTLSRVWGPAQESNCPQDGATAERILSQLGPIFPEDQIRHVLSMRPELTDAAEVCRVICDVFKK